MSDTYSGDNGLTPRKSYAYVVSGRVASITSGDLGTQRYTYDAEGHKASMAEPSGGSVDSPATVTYTYYSTRTRSQLTIAAAAFALPVTLEYAY